MMLRGGHGDADAWSRSRNEPALHSTESRINIIGHRKGYRRNMQTFYPDGITEALDTGQDRHGVAIGIPLTNEDMEALENAEDRPGIFCTACRRLHCILCLV